MIAFLDAGNCVNGHPLPPFRLETLLGASGEPVQAWITECRVPMRTVIDGRRAVAECASRVTIEFVPLEAG